LEKHQDCSAIFDALVIGAGPAGVSCAVWLARLGFSPALVEASARIGGLCLTHSYLDGWNASLPQQTGEQTANNLALSVAQASIPVYLSYSVARIWQYEQVFYAINQPHKHALRARHLVLATGVQARRLPGFPADIPGILTGPGAHVLAQDFRGKTLAVLGGGDNAFENALYAMQHGAKQVHIIARSIRAQRQFVQRMPAAQVLRHNNVTVSPDPLTVNGKPYDLVLVCYGWEPCVPACQGLPLQRDTHGFLQTAPHTAQTSVPGVYAIGEVARRQHPCVVTAMADGVVAAKAIQARLECNAHTA